MYLTVVNLWPANQLICWVNFFIKCLFNNWAPVQTAQMDFPVIALITENFLTKGKDKKVMRAVREQPEKWLQSSGVLPWAGWLEQAAHPSEPKGPAVNLGVIVCSFCFFSAYCLPLQSLHPPALQPASFLLPQHTSAVTAAASQPARLCTWPTNKYKLRKAVACALNLTILPLVSSPITFESRGNCKV